MSEPARRKQRKRRRPTASADAAPETAPRTPSEPEPSEPEAGNDMARGYAKSRARDQAARAALKPLNPGERPTAVTVGAAFVLLLGLLALVPFLAGVKIDGERPNAAFVLLFSAMMLLAAWGAWRVRYWAVLGIQALLCLIILYFSVLAIKFQSAVELLIAAAILIPAGTLFWYLVKSMARIQMPERPGAE